MLGEFRISTSRNGVTVLIFGPKNLAQANSGVPQAAIVLRNMDGLAPPDLPQLVDFLNAAIAVSHGDNAPMDKLLGKTAA